MADPHPSNDPPDYTRQEPPPHPDLRWFLRRELVALPLALVLVLTLLVFGISSATLLFVALLAIVVLGVVWSRG